MIIKLSKIDFGGGGGGSYTLPVATASRLGGVKVGSGLDITAGGVLSVTGGSSSDGQKLWTAATPADMAALTGVSEGDVCVVAAHYDEMPEYFQMLQNWEWGFLGCWSNTYDNQSVTPPSTIRLTLVENPYWDEVSTTTQDGAYSEFSYWHHDDVQQTDLWDITGVRCDSGDYKYFNELDQTSNPDPNDYTAFSGVGDSIIVNSSNSFNSGSGTNENELFEHSSNTSFQYVIRIEQEVAQETYQYNNGEWIKLACADDVSSAMTLAQDAYNSAEGKVDKGSIGIGEWSSITYFGTCISEVQVNSVSQGYRIHTPGASTERENPKVTEIVTSGDVARIVALTQDEYDQMQTHDNNTLYAIIPDTN